jgi:hypothetical protein
MINNVSPIFEFTYFKHVKLYKRGNIVKEMIEERMDPSVREELKSR